LAITSQPQTLEGQSRVLKILIFALFILKKKQVNCYLKIFLRPWWRHLKIL